LQVCLVDKKQSATETVSGTKNDSESECQLALFPVWWVRLVLIPLINLVASLSLSFESEIFPFSLRWG